MVAPDNQDPLWLSLGFYSGLTCHTTGCAHVLCLRPVAAILAPRPTKAQLHMCAEWWGAMTWMPDPTEGSVELPPSVGGSDLVELLPSVSSGGGAMSVPPSVKTSEEGPAVDPDVVALPEDVELDQNCCKHNCLKQVCLNTSARDARARLRWEGDHFYHGSARAFAFHHCNRHLVDEPTVNQQKFNFHGAPMCEAATSCPTCTSSIMVPYPIASSL